MRNNKAKIVAFLLVAVLCLGIGFAATSDDLLVTGVLKWNRQYLFPYNVYFSGKGDVPDGVTLSGYATEGKQPTTPDEYDTLHVTIKAGTLIMKGDKVTFSAYIKNDFTAPVTIAFGAPYSGSNQTLNEHLRVTSDITGSDTIQPGSTNLVTFTVELAKTPTLATDNDLSFWFDIPITAEYTPSSN